MFATFNYNRSDEQMFNDIVDAALDAIKMSASGRIEDRAAYSELLSDINGNVAHYITVGTRYATECESKGGEVLKNPNVQKNKDVHERFNAVIAEIINAAIPTTTSMRLGEELIDIHQVGWGDTARFLISSIELFQVNEIGEGILRGILQPIFNNEVTVNASPIEIATEIDWYAVAAGNFDWGNFGYRAGRSFEGYILLKGIAAFLSAAPAAGTPFAANGVDSDQWTTLAERISSMNGGADVYAIGTLNALAKVYPNVTGLQYGLGQEIAKNGFLDRYLGVRLLPIDNFILPGQGLTSAALGVPTDMIIMVAANAYKPIKVVFEGNSVSVEWMPDKTVDKTYRVRVQMRIGVAAIVGSVAGVIRLPAGNTGA